MVVVWNKRAIRQLLDIMQYLDDNASPSYALRIENEILSSIEKLPKNFQVHQLDRFKLDNDKTFYAFEVDVFRISYRCLKNQIRILRIRHTSRIPVIH